MTETWGKNKLATIALYIIFIYPCTVNPQNAVPKYIQKPPREFKTDTVYLTTGI